jgi:alpha-beta hydrolase superfamily lysophospholipase
MSPSTIPISPAPAQPATEATAPRKHRGRRALIWTAAVCATLLALVYAAGGWYFSGRIDTAILQSSPAPMGATYNLEVTQFGDGTVTYRSSGDLSPSFDQASSYALLWDGGWAHLGPPTVTDGTTVTRPMTDVTGTAPVAGTPAALERDWYIGDPMSALGYPFRTIEVTDSHGTLPGWYVPAAQPSTWTAVMVHGREGFPREMLRELKVVHEAGLNAVVITYFGDYGNAPYPDGRFDWGQTEDEDVAAFVDWARRNGAEHLVLMGNSMGTAVVSGYLASSPDVTDIDGVFLDSLAVDVGAVVDEGAKTVALPVVGAPTQSLVAFAEWIAGLRFGVDWEAINYSDEPVWDKVQTLAVHGDADPQIGVQVARDFAAAHPGTVRYEEFPGAQHVESWNTDRARYEALLGSWLRERMQAPGA